MFKRYSSPFNLLNMLIELNQLSDFITDLNKIRTEEIEYEVWLHKDYNCSFVDFKKNIRKTSDAHTDFTQDDIKTTVKRSFDMLSNFKP